MHTVLNKSTNQEVSIEEGETIYEGFLRHGIDLPHGCIAGSCGACLIKIESGPEDALTEPRTIEMDTIQTIRSARSIPESERLRLSCRARVQASLEFSLPNKS